MSIIKNRIATLLALPVLVAGGLLVGGASAQADPSQGYECDVVANALDVVTGTICTTVGSVPTTGLIFGEFFIDDGVTQYDCVGLLGPNFPTGEALLPAEVIGEGCTAV
ncbi:hypothetical protein [Actinocrispum wychmicini]|uniref:Uncharacterized protein n=1 Tax=Actinocrispum wychmicini TaxID=1213861 RepID=A0A4R2KCV0_9PSEU|nr:hypothetical protein [Actinocrispum wychmicini]TCO64325.1 hypothetical protein EV192_10192 [Actinocrispum wychmicini]